MTVLPPHLFQPRYSRAYCQLFSIYAAVILVAALNLVLAPTLSDLPRLALHAACALTIGGTIHVLFLFLHEAAHFHLARRPSTNNLIANWLIGPWFLQGIESFRARHFAHHRLLGTEHDPENTYFFALTAPRLLGYLFGVYAAQKMIRERGRLGLPRASLGLAFLGYHLSALAALSAFGGWRAAVILWLIPFLVVFPFLAATRQALEHRPYGIARRDLSRVAEGREARLFLGFMAPLIGAAGFRWHWYHHRYPGVPCSRLGEVARLLGAAEGQPRAESYSVTFYRLFREAVVG